MPRSGHPRRDSVAQRSGYVSHDNNPVDRRGGPETYSGRINHAHMNEHASRDTFLPSVSASFDPRSRDLYVHHDRLFSSTASDLSGIPSRDDLYRSEPSQELERRARGYNPGYFGERMSSHGSSPQLGGRDHGYRDEPKDWPRDTPIKIDYNDYVQDEKRGFQQGEEYREYEKQWEESRNSTAYRPPQLRNEDAFDRRQSLAAAEASTSYQSASEKRNNHNHDYIGHWPRAKRKGHKHAVKVAQKESDRFREESQRHTDSSRRRRWRKEWEADLEEFFPEEDC